MATKPKSALELASEKLATLPDHMREEFFKKGFRPAAIQHHNEYLASIAPEDDSTDVTPDSK